MKIQQNMHWFTLSRHCKIALIIGFTIINTGLLSMAQNVKSKITLTVQVNLVPQLSREVKVVLAPASPNFDTVFATTDSTGHLQLNSIEAGNYRIWVTCSGYRFLKRDISVSPTTNQFVFTLNNRSVPTTGVYIDPNSLRVVWEPFSNDTILLFDDFSNGSFASFWALIGDNWHISQEAGWPLPCGYFGWPPLVNNYDMTLTSPIIANPGLDSLKFEYDWGLQNYGCNGDGFFDVDINAGNGWITLKHLNRAYCGSVAWQHETIDLTPYQYKDFQIRFHMYGPCNDCFDRWEFDNIKLSATFGFHTPPTHNLYLNQELIATTPDTAYLIADSLVDYGDAINVCVGNVYGITNGIPVLTCHSIVSRHLPSPNELLCQQNQDIVGLSWVQPNPVQASLVGYKILRGGICQAQVSANTLMYFDTLQNPSYHCYSVQAVYNLSTLGLVDSIGFSEESAPICKMFVYGYPPPFYETWEQNSSQYDEWNIEPSDSPWHINLAQGIDAPCIAFEPTTIIPYFSCALESPVIDLSKQECSKFTVSFWAKWHSTTISFIGNYLNCEVWDGSSWYNLTQLGGDDMLDWQKFSFSLPETFQNSMRIKFTAIGIESQGLTMYYIDSLCVKGKVSAPINLTLNQSGLYNLSLDWDPIHCGTNGWNEFPIGYLAPTVQTNSVIQQTKGYAYGQVIDIPWSGPVSFKSISFTHHANGLKGKWPFRIHLFNFTTKQPLTIIGPVYTSINDGKEIDIPLADENTKYYSLPWDPIGVFIEPLSSQDSNAYPLIASIASWVPSTNSFKVSLPNYDTIESYPDDIFQITLKFKVQGKSYSTTGPCFLDSLAGYHVYRNGDWIASTDWDKTNFTDSLINNGEYCYYVRAAVNSPNGLLYSTPTDTQCFTITTQENINQSQFRIYPNPSHGQITLVVPNQQTGSVEIYELTGKHMLSLPFHATKACFDVSKLKKGIYIVHVTSTKQNYCTKLLVQ